MEETTTLDTKKRGRPTKVVQDDTKALVTEFLDAVAMAKSEGAESIETSEAIIAHYNRNGLNGAKFFIYEGIKVYPEGKTEEIEEEANQPLHYKIHGKDEAKVDNLG